MFFSEAKQFLEQEPRAMLSFLVENNPTAVYNHIAFHFPNKFPVLAKGAEHFSQEKERMHDYLEERARMSGNPALYIAMLSNLIPYNPNAMESGSDMESFTVLYSDEKVQSQGIAAGEYHPKLSNI